MALGNTVLCGSYVCMSMHTEAWPVYLCNFLPLLSETLYVITLTQLLLSLFNSLTRNIARLSLSLACSFRRLHRSTHQIVTAMRKAQRMMDVQARPYFGSYFRNSLNALN